MPCKSRFAQAVFRKKREQKAQAREECIWF